MLSRHGSRYPTTGSNVFNLGEKIAKHAGKFTAKGPLAFLNDWQFQLGAEILVPKGIAESTILDISKANNLTQADKSSSIRVWLLKLERESFG
jgi:hypothetical protein